jgi:outer membrane protein OmpA-like peptidoglycan-associated protein
VIDLCRSYAESRTHAGGTGGQSPGNAVVFMGASLFSWIGVEERSARSACQLAVLAFLLGLGACNPVETWRDWTGASQNDPDPDTTPNTKNLVAGEAADYPNLATVPPPPVRGMTAAEREKLTQSLIADRANARYTDEQLRASFSASPAAPPPPPASSASEANTTQPEPAGVAPPPAPASEAASKPSPAQTGAAAAAPQPSPSSTTSATAAPSSVKSAANTPGEKPSAATRSARAGGKKPAEAGEGPRKQSDPPEPGPMESNLEIPQARATPQPEQVRPAPPPPSLPPTPKVANAPPALPPGLAAGGVLARTPSAARAGSAGFQPPPPPPELPPPAPSRSAAAAESKASTKAPAPAAKPVTEIKFGADSTSLTDKDKQTLEAVLPIYQQNPGKIRIVGYAGGGGGAVEQLNSYRTALDRAQAVAAALKQAGIPSDKIQVEAAPGGANSGENRAEVLLEH